MIKTERGDQFERLSLPQALTWIATNGELAEGAEFDLSVCERAWQALASLLERWSRFLRQPAKVGSSMLRMTHHEDAETVCG
jgi:hypothetical protein